MDEKDSSGKKSRGKKPDDTAQGGGGSGKVQMIATEDIRMHPHL